MAEGLNKVMLIGNLGADPELKFVGSNDEPVLRIRIATTEKWKDRDGKDAEATEWHTISVWGKRGEGLSRVLSKGDRIYVEGKIRTRKVEGKESGDPDRYFTEVRASDIILLGGPRRQDDEQDDRGSRRNGRDNRERQDTRGPKGRDDRDYEFPPPPEENEPALPARGDGRRSDDRGRRKGWD